MELTLNQKIELKYFDSFRQHYALPHGTIEHSDKPDVLVLGEDEQRILGIEIARLYKTDGQLEESDQRQIPKRLIVVELAEQMYRARGGRKIELSVSFDPKHPIGRKPHMQKIANDLASFALEISSQQDGHQSYSPLEDTPELSWIFHNGKEYPNSAWLPVQSYDVPELLVPRVKDLVAKKIRKTQGYEACGVMWLLLIVDFWEPSQDQEIHWPAEENVGKTPFERILIYKTCFNEVVEVSQRGADI
jgi:hypothetical protein